MKLRRAFLALWLACAFMLPLLLKAQDANLTIHVVQRGENLFQIALSYGMTVDELAQLNGILDPSSIQVGQRLLVPASATVPQTHVVQAGETLGSIAELYGLTLEELATINDIADVNAIYIGQTLTLIAPSPSEIVRTAASLPSVLYVVQPGETLFSIATRFGLTVNDVAQANSISDPTLVYAGQQLMLPGVEPPPLALDLPAPVTGLQVNPLILVEGRSGRFRMTTAAPVSVTGTFLGRSLMVISEENNTVHTILVGVPVFTETGIYPLLLSVTDSNGATVTVNANVQILSGGYGNEDVTLLADRQNLLDPAVEQAEQNRIQQVMSAFTPTRYLNGPMGLPAAATVISPFGVRRSFNGGGFDRFHSGADFGGAPGTPIVAAAPGVVVLAETLNVRGNATIIDHGWGVLTGYWHQSDQFVQVGDSVTMGQPIGTMGATGRVSGPHLHWEMWVSGVPVDPMQWVLQSFI